MADLHFAELPDRRSLLRQWYKVYGPKGLTPLRVVTLGDAVSGVFTHFDDGPGRMVLCGGEARCPFCKQERKRRWVGYVAAFRADTRDLCIAEVSEGAARQLEGLGKFKAGLRGHLLTLRRYKPYPNAPVFAELKPVANPDAIPAAFDIIPHLQRLWGLIERQAGSTDSRAAVNALNGALLSGIGRNAGGLSA